MDSLSISQVKERGLLLFECISGSHAYGTAIPGSDTDLKGIYIAPPEHFFGLEYALQINEDNNDKAYYEIGRFIELLSKSNPNMLEMLSIPEDCVLFKHPLMELVIPELFISKLCKESFAGYAQTQIKKAYGLNKKILNPVEPHRKSIIDFCYVIIGHQSMPLALWLREKGWRQEDCGLLNIDHARNVYALFHSSDGNYQGVMQHVDSNDVACSSIEKGSIAEAYLVFNKDGYKSHCKEYKEYWDWVKNRNQLRYENTQTHGKQYDAKNMMHTFRLLHMAEEIGLSGQINVRRHDRDFLLQIRSGHFEYEELLAMADKKLEEINVAFETSSLPDRVDLNKINQILFDIRTRFYQSYLK